MAWDPAAHVACWNDRARAAGICQGRGMSHAVPAVYLWHKGPGRSTLPLCAECCARWRESAADPEGVVDLPEKITML